MKIKVKICCISSIEEARLAVAYGAAAIGLVGRMPSGPGIITDELINSIAKTVIPPIDSFLLTSETTAEAIIEHHNKVNTTTIQMVDALSGREYHKIREAIPNVQLVQVIHVLDEGSIKEAIEISEFVDAILLDLEAGKGSAGKLLKDDALYSNLKTTTKEMELLLRDVRLFPTRYINVSVFGKKNKPYVVPVQDSIFVGPTKGDNSKIKK